MQPKFWEQCLFDLQNNFDEQQFNTWVRPLQAIAENNIIKITAPNQYAVDWASKNLSEYFVKKLEDSEYSFKFEIGGISQKIGINNPVIEEDKKEIFNNKVKFSSEFTFDNFTTSFQYREESGLIGNANSVANQTKFNVGEFNSISFSTRRNREINLTEFYDLVYEYENDCLIASLKYRKDYYNSADIVPKEELFFSITIIPFYTYSPDKMILNKDRQGRKDKQKRDALGLQ